MATSELAGARPLISVIVPTWNSAVLLPQALQSLAAQTFRDFEVVVSDCASSDGTLAAARQFLHSVPRLVIDSRLDRGVYDAINRGVMISSGTWLLVLGSDDTLHAPDTFARVAAALQADDVVEMVYGDVRMMADNLCGVPAGGRFAGPITLSWLFAANVCQQCIFYRRSLYDVLGGFNERYRLYADWDFNLRAAFRGNTRWIDVVVSDYAATGMSATADDTVFRGDMPELVRQEFLCRAADRWLWPHQRRGLLKTARQLRKQRLWRAWGLQLWAYARLLALRVRFRFEKAA